MEKTRYFSMRWWCGSLCTRPTRFVGDLLMYITMH